MATSPVAPEMEQDPNMDQQAPMSPNDPNSNPAMAAQESPEQFAMDQQATDQPMPEEEPYGAQVLRRVHQDHQMLMREYDEMLGPLDNDMVRSYMEEMLSGVDRLLSGIEQMFGQTYGHLPGIDGTVPNAEEGELQNNDIDGAVTDAIGATSGGRELPTEEEAYEGTMTMGKKSLKNKKMREDEEYHNDVDEYDEEEEEELEDDEDYEDEEESDKKKYEEDQEDDEDHLEEDHMDSGAIDEYEKKDLYNARNHIKMISDTDTDYTDEMKSLSFHYSKTLERIGKKLKDHLSVLGKHSSKSINGKSAPWHKEMEEKDLDTKCGMECSKALFIAAKFLNDVRNEKAFGLIHKNLANDLVKMYDERVLDPIEEEEELEEEYEEEQEEEDDLHEEEEENEEDERDTVHEMEELCEACECDPCECNDVLSPEELEELGGEPTGFESEENHPTKVGGVGRKKRV